MKLYHLLLGAALCTTVSSCFKDEPLNAECDIEQAYVQIDDPAEIFFSANDTLINVPSDNLNITFSIKNGADVSAMAPKFRVTEGAKVTLPDDNSMQDANGSVHDFSDGKVVTYVVTSQDGSWSRTYNVSFKEQSTVGNYDFENFRLVDGTAGGQYYEWSDIAADGSWMGNWATGNIGFNLSASSTAADEYPTSPVSEGYFGAGVRLETKGTGSLGELFDMGIAAGNLFIGYFNIRYALGQTMKATEFGLPFDREPVSFTGWYKYKSAGECIDGEMNAIPGSYDKGDIYAVLYRNKYAGGNAFVLHGDDVKTSPQIVAIAQVPEVTDTDGWTQFTVNFEYSEDIDRDLLANRGYNLAVVFTSSIEGATFKGAIGSTLYIDEVKVICADQNEQP